MMKPLSFLFVDDDADDAFLFNEVLSEIDSSVKFHWAKDGQEGLDKLNSDAILPDLIFLDLNMPRLSGKEFLLYLKEDAQLARIPVIIYTTSSQSKDIEETIMCGAICFITKPSSVNELKYILSFIIDGMPHNLTKALRELSNSANTFIVC